MYAHDLNNNGHNFHFGRMIPGMEIIYRYTVTDLSKILCLICFILIMNSLYIEHFNYDPLGVVRSTHSSELSLEFGYVQARDYVPGTGRLVAFDGLGSNSFTISLESGPGEDLDTVIHFYG